MARAAGVGVPVDRMGFPDRDIRVKILGAFSRYRDVASWLAGFILDGEAGSAIPLFLAKLQNGTASRLEKKGPIFRQDGGVTDSRAAAFRHWNAPWPKTPALANSGARLPFSAIQGRSSSRMESTLLEPFGLCVWNTAWPADHSTGLTPTQWAEFGFIVKLSRVFRFTAHRGGVAGGFAGAAAGGGLC